MRKMLIGGQPLIFFGQQTRKENEWESTFQCVSKMKNMFILLYDENYRIQRTASHAKLGHMKMKIKNIFFFL